MSSTKVSMPDTVAAPTTAESTQAWMEALPQIYQTQAQYEPLLQSQSLALQSQYGQTMAQQQADLNAKYQPQMMEQQMQLQNKYAPEMLKQQYDMQAQYAPQMLQQQYDMQMKYAPMMAEAQKAISDKLYPQTAALQEQLSKQASEGMNSQMPDWQRQEYLNNMRGSLGENATSGIAADYTSRGLMEQQKGWQDYYRNLGLQMTGRMPLTQAGQVQTPQVQMPQVNAPQVNNAQYQGTNWTQGWNPNSVYGQQSQNWANQQNVTGQLTQAMWNKNNQGTNLGIFGKWGSA